MNRPSLPINYRNSPVEIIDNINDATDWVNGNGATGTRSTVAGKESSNCVEFLPTAVDFRSDLLLVDLTGFTLAANPTFSMWIHSTKQFSGVEDIVLFIANQAFTVYRQIVFGAGSGVSPRIDAGWQQIQWKWSDMTPVGAADHISDLGATARVRVSVRNLSGETVRCQNLRIYSRAKTKVMITADDAAEMVYDDGSIGMFRTCQPKGLSGTFFVIAGNGEGVDSGAGFVTTAQLQLMANDESAPWLIAVHGPSLSSRGTNWTTMSIADAAQDMADTQTYLTENGMGNGIGHCSYPEGAFNDDVITAVKAAGIKTARTTNGRNSLLQYTSSVYADENDLLNLYTITVGGAALSAQDVIDRIGSAIDRGASIVLMLHQLVSVAEVNTQQWLDTKFEALTDELVRLQNRGLIDVVTVKEFKDGKQGIRPAITGDPGVAP